MPTLAILLTGGNIADCTAGELLLGAMRRCSIVHADKAFGSDAIRRQIEAAGPMPKIPL